MSREKNTHALIRVIMLTFEVLNDNMRISENVHQGEAHNYLKTGFPKMEISVS